MFSRVKSLNVSRDQPHSSPAAALWFSVPPRPSQVALARTRSGETSWLRSRLREDAEGASLVIWWAMDKVRKTLVAVAVLGMGAGVGSTLFALVVPGELQKQAMLQVETTGLPEVGVRGKRPLSSGLVCKLPSCP